MENVEWTSAALSDLDKLDKHIAVRIVKKISWFAENFENITPEPLTGKFKKTYKFRVGDFKIIYTLEQDIIVIQFVGHRSEIYRQNR